MIVRGWHVAAAGVVMAVLTGCSAHSVALRDPYVEATALEGRLNAQMPSPVRLEGSLFDQNRAPLGWVADLRAARLGDLVTIRVVESASGSHDSSTQVEKNSSGSMGLPSLFGLEADLDNRVTTGFSTAELLAYAREHSFQGDGATSRQDSLVATIGARVVAVLPSGNLVVAGSREILVNRDRQVMTLAGVVRPVDVGPDNSVPSTAVTELSVQYGGHGNVSDAARDGWLNKYIDRVWPF